MNPRVEVPQNNPPVWEPFPEPHTIPTGWDLSEYLHETPETVDVLPESTEKQQNLP
jgi:hypothetical protein